MRVAWPNLRRRSALLRRGTPTIPHCFIGCHRRRHRGKCDAPRRAYSAGRVALRARSSLLELEPNADDDGDVSEISAIASDLVEARFDERAKQGQREREPGTDVEPEVGRRAAAGI